MNQSTNPAAVQELDLLQMWRRIRSRPVLVLAGAICGGMVGVGVALLTKPVYRAEIVIAPVAADDGSGTLAGLTGKLGGLAAVAGLSGMSGDEREVEAKATIESRILVETLIRKLDLMPALFAEDWNAETRQWRSSSVGKTPTLWEGTRYFMRSIRKIKPDSKTNLLTVTVDWTDKKVVAVWATQLVKEANLMMSQRALTRAQRNIDYLEVQLGKTSVVEVRESIFKLLESEIKTVMLAQSGEDYAFKIIDPAVEPEKKIWPMRGLLSIGGVLAGLMVGMILALVMGPRKAT